jgi:hypothetical protein
MDWDNLKLCFCLSYSKSDRVRGQTWWKSLQHTVEFETGAKVVDIGIAQWLLYESS